MKEQPFALFACKTILLAGAAWAVFFTVSRVVFELIDFIKR